MTEDETPARIAPSGDIQPPDAPQVVDATTGDSEYRVAGELIHESVSFRSAPYPTPHELREYEEIHPGFTDRILTLTERETEHRIQEERVQNRATVEIAKRGQSYAFIVVMTLVAGGIAAILTGHSVAGFAGLITAAVALVGAFVAPSLFSRRSHRHEQDTGPRDP